MIKLKQKQTQNQTTLKSFLTEIHLNLQHVCLELSTIFCNFKLIIADKLDGTALFIYLYFCISLELSVLFGHLISC